ncbi:hypothetical protein NDU88_003854 [Pleurodeles waltl]|uniref:Uncharacterized protein n=1 Tax=Pleurodeles waltl TaxID=8319 RepID=A0AAV7KZ88_PLEWA|nr:hypothetical protein NDU88_003854 [Pleurodeles waltl]
MVFDYRDTDAILQAAYMHGDHTYENATIRFFPDFTLQVQCQRRSFDKVKKVLRSKDIKYMVLFPARLRVVTEGKSWFFATPAEAWDWVGHNRKTLPRGHKDKSCHRPANQRRTGTISNKCIGPGSF